ncbi:unnamed protein product [Rotaria sp. Silwood1]|nr:unnamed protein product [Rotaria sp. Silwood1]
MFCFFISTNDHNSHINKKYNNFEKHQAEPQSRKKRLGSNAIRHIFHGVIDLNNDGILVAQGVHSLVDCPSNVKVVRRIQKPDRNNVYAVRLAMTDLETGKIYKKNSTMFPETWSKERIIAEVESVLERITICPTTTGKSLTLCFSSLTSPSGIPLNIIYENGRPVSAYPIWQK